MIINYRCIAKGMIFFFFGTFFFFCFAREQKKKKVQVQTQRFEKQKTQGINKTGFLIRILNQLDSHGESNCCSRLGMTCNVNSFYLQKSAGSPRRCAPRDDMLLLIVDIHQLIQTAGLNRFSYYIG